MNVALLSTDLTPAPSEKAYIEIMKAIKIEMLIVLKLTLLFKLLNEQQESFYYWIIIRLKIHDQNTIICKKILVQQIFIVF